MKVRRYIRTLLSICLGAVMFGNMTGCSFPGVENQKENEARTTLEVWAWDNNFNVKAVMLAAEIYEEEHPDVEIRVVSKEKNEIIQKLSNDFSAEVYEELPDIVLIEDYEIQKLLSNHEHEFRELDDTIDYSKFQDYKTKLVEKDGVHYGLPFDSGVAVMFYRLDYLEQAGYTEADMQDITWSRYLEIGRRVREKVGVPMLTVQPDDVGIIRIMMQSAGRWYVKEDGTTADIAGNVPLQEALGIYRSLIEDDLVCTINGWEGFVQAFQNGKVATVVSGCWIAPTIRASQEQSGLWRVAPIPRMENVPGAVNVSNIGGSSWYVLKNKKHGDAAAAFLKETFGEDRGFINQLVEEIDLVSSRKDAEELPAYEKEDEYFGNTSILQGFIRSAKEIPAVNYGSSTYEIEAILCKEIQSILKGEEIEEGLEKIQLKTRALIG